VAARSLRDFGLGGPSEVVCLSLRYQVAQKLYACTEGFEDRENEHLHDLTDLQLMQELIEDRDRVRQACVETFALRQAHAWQPTLTIGAVALDVALWLRRRKPWMAVRLLAMLWWFLVGELYGLLGLLWIWALSGGRDGPVGGIPCIASSAVGLGATSQVSARCSACGSKFATLPRPNRRQQERAKVKGDERPHCAESLRTAGRAAARGQRDDRCIR
jgi:hypothetical protein